MKTTTDTTTTTIDTIDTTDTTTTPGTHDHYRETLREILAVNGWKRGSQAARRAEYAFLQGIQAAIGVTPFTYIPLISGRSILD